MQATFESILPIFLLILCGNILRRVNVVDLAGWDGINQLGYWFFYPTLIFVTIVNADFAGLRLDSMMLALAITLPLMFIFVLSLWPFLRKAGLAGAAEFSSIFQTSIRWNGFMALAIAQKLFPPAGMAVVALAMAIIILPINLVTVFVVTRFADRTANWLTLIRRMATNPMVIAAAGGLLLRALPFELFAPVNKTLQLIGQAALGLGLVGIGAGLRLDSLVKPKTAILVPVAVKLVIFPALLLAVSLSLGITGEELLFLVLCGAVPTAMNGYVLAKQMGGDAELYATVTTLQTLLSFATVPAALLSAAQLVGG
ncbi:AEC family transporter [Mesorhizobium sp. M9A.F.Ca.ET.002.03.1.2]|uniref:AEC family transporter n=1 Tax=Mesorhizobium sp. M9A.F.Ca.ET.002.03.1.2 TaxID=2493668 RepID=UPI000F75B6BF|nr:AEC family transporter [Mesorhizobium sp. M9A.F.Ca.ET.002.03.1.2]AZN99747.1 AEC family transporter [Mesorhizobium sp. M9A.F.Ca.ET.002.03.1.2]